MARVKKFETWLRRHLYNERNEQRCSKFVLHHMGAAGKLGSEVFTVPSDIPEESITSVAEEIFEAGEADASGVGSTQSYVVLAFYGADKKPNGRFAFRAQADNDDIDGGEITEPPTPAGQVSQAMRHNESIMRTSSMAMGATFQGLQQMILQQSQTIENLLSDRFNTVELIEALTTAKHERELELLQEARKDETQRQLVEKFSPLVPIVANKIAGKPMLPAADPQSLMLSELFKTLKPEQLAAIQNTLTPEQAMIVLSLAQDYVGSDETEGGNGSS